MLVLMRLRSTFVLAMAVAALLMMSVVARATEQTSTSSPTGRVTVRSASLSTTNQDGDGNPDTATNGDIVEFAGSVTNNTASPQRETITVALDLPGTRYDLSVTKTISLSAGRTGQVSLKLRIFRFLPRGAYMTSVMADDGSENAAATSVVTLTGG